MNKEGKNQLFQMIIIVAILLVAIIPTVTFCISKANQATQQQTETNHMISVLIEKIDKMEQGLTAEEVQAMIDKIDTGLTAEEVQAMIDKIDTGLTAEEVQAMIEKALADLKENE